MKSGHGYISNKFAEFKKDYRHIICVVITLISLGLGVLFPNALPRLAETVRDLATSFLYYFADLFYEEQNPIQPTVTFMQSWQFAEQIWKPIELFPLSWDEFQYLWNEYWNLFLSERNFENYLAFLGKLFLYLSRFLFVLLPFLLVLILLVNGYKEKRCNIRNLESKELKSFKEFQFKYLYPVLAWIRDFKYFLEENSIYYSTWLVLWCLYFNIFSIFIAFVAYYFYFVASWDLISLLPQAAKLLYDLTPMIRFVPTLLWTLLGIAIYNYLCKSLAFSRLYYAERCNRSFLSGRGVVTTVYGEMGIGKTQMITSMALSAEIEQFDMAFEILLEKDMEFPNFPWQNFRDQLKKRIDCRKIVDLPSCRKWVRTGKAYFDYIASTYTPDEWKQRHKECKYIKTDYTFGYDYAHYRTTYKDELKVTHLFESLEDYACAYLIFTVKTSLLFSNYSIRVDSILRDLGNMPSRDNDFVNREAEYQDAYSRHAHIIDVDMLRLGKKVIKDNPKARRLSFGVFVITEIDKEFKNMQELKETKINEKETNQKNDLHNACIMMSRHAAVVANRVFIRIIADLQRPEAWGAGGRELGEIIYISNKSELAPALPFFSPYWFTQGLYSWIREWWDSFYACYIENRSDNTLFTYLFKNIMSMLNNHYDKINGLLGTQTLTLEIQSGRMDGEVKKDKWRLIMKKDRSRRYKTACLEAVFDSYVPNTMHIDDFIMYSGEVGTDEENQLQNSYFQMDIAKMKALNLEKENKNAKT